MPRCLRQICMSPAFLSRTLPSKACEGSESPGKEQITSLFWEQTEISSVIHEKARSTRQYQALQVLYQQQRRGQDQMFQPLLFRGPPILQRKCCAVFPRGLSDTQV